MVLIILEVYLLNNKLQLIILTKVNYRVSILFEKFFVIVLLVRLSIFTNKRLLLVILCSWTVS